jgi:hypothetical protein
MLMASSGALALLAVAMVVLSIVGTGEPCRACRIVL